MPNAKKVAAPDIILDDFDNRDDDEPVEIKWNNFDPYLLEPLPELPELFEPIVKKPRAKKSDKAKENLNYLERVVKMFSHRHGQTSRWAVGTPGGLRLFPAEICHAALGEIPENVTMFASNFDVAVDMVEKGEAYWQFMIGDQSPYRCLFEHGVPEKLFFKDGCQSGFVMNNIDIVDKEKTTLVYNFCIAMRMVHEYPETIKAWYHFTKEKGMHPVDALYFARMFQPITKAFGFLFNYQNNDGCHWPLWYHGAEYSANRAGRYIDFDRLYNGQPTFDGRSCNQWTSKPKEEKPLPDFRTKVKSEVVSRGVFTRLEGIPEDAVIAEFLAWKIEYQKSLKGE